MSASPKTLKEALDSIVIWGGEEGEYEWTLGELEEDASWTITAVLTSHIVKLRRPVADKLVFGDTASVNNAAFNEALDQLILDIEEKRV